MNVLEENSGLDPLQKDDRLRSDFVKELVLGSKKPSNETPVNLLQPPKTIVQFWDDLEALPGDVYDCMKSWKTLENSGFEHQIFDNSSTRDFIKVHLGSRYVNAFDKCYHPSMKSDYFRYSYIFVKGGFYIDADDVYHGGQVEHLFNEGKLKLQPFCYDIATSQMVPPKEFMKEGSDNLNWIFYFNNTPMIAGPNHPIIERALLNATLALEEGCENGRLPEVQSTTGPGNLSRSVFEVVTEQNCANKLLVVMYDWEKTSTCKWQLSYRNDQRNWRLSNQQMYRSTKEAEQP